MNKDTLNSQLIEAIRAGKIEEVGQLLKNGAHANAAPQNNMLWNDRTPLQHAIALGHFRIAEELIENGADVTAANNRGQTALHVLAENLGSGSKNMALLLIKRGADVDAQDKREETPRQILERNGATEIIGVIDAVLKDRNPASFQSRVDKSGFIAR